MTRGSEVQRTLSTLRRLVSRLGTDPAIEHLTGLSAAQFTTLWFIRAKPSASLNELAVKLSTDKSSASVMITRLAEAGLVLRQRSAKDRRRLDLRLTDRAEHLLQGVPTPTSDEQLFAAVRGLAPGERRILLRCLHALVSTLDGQRSPR